SASATAEESPARPPPITITLFEDIVLGVPAKPRTQKDPGFFGGAQPYAFGENIVAALFDAPQQPAINARQRPESGPRVGVYVGNQFHAFTVKIQSASGFE